MFRFMVSCFMLAVLSVTCWAQNNRLSLASPPQGGVLTKNKAATQTSQPNPTNDGIDYHGGPVMDNGANVHFIWYGHWNNNTAPEILTYLAKHIGGTAYFNINTSYYDYNPGGEKNPAKNSVNFGGSIFDNYSLGSYLTDNNVANIVGFALGDPSASAGYPRLPVDPSGVYFVLTSPDVTEQSFAPLGPFCAWHGYGFLGTTPIKVAFIGDSDAVPSGCQWQNPSPNNNPAADDAASMFVHELSETVTDPQFSAWCRTSDGSEMGDLCQRKFGNTKVLPNGSSYNLTFAMRPYHLQRLWVNGGGGTAPWLWTSKLRSLPFTASRMSGTRKPFASFKERNCTIGCFQRGRGENRNSINLVTS
jgi:hypothetical protein